MTAVIDETGAWTLKKSSGGLVSALSAVEDLHMTLIGWPGADVPPEDRENVTSQMKDHSCIPVYLSHEEIELYYNGFSNGVLWPLFHYVTPALITGSSEPEWNMYMKVNKEFAAVVASVINGSGEKDTLVWIHDYHLMLVPKYLREYLPNANIGFFLHTPFPSAELFRMLPYREEVLQGLLSSNFIGFQVKDYCRHFVTACSQLTSLQVTASCVDALPIGGALVHCGTVPIGIDPFPFIHGSLENDRVAAKVEELQASGRKIVLGVDRLDYMKGIQHKLQGYEKFLDLHPEWASQCVLIQLAVPSRGQVREYQRLRKHVHEQVGRLCGKHSHLTSGPPVLYMDQAIDFEGLVALYRAADVMLITSIRDGMNLVAFEYVAAQEGSHGVLVLSEFAGAMQAMGGGALRVNPWNVDETSQVIHRALNMDEEERKSRHQFCFEYVTTYTANRWADQFIENLKNSVAETEAIKASVPPLLSLDRVENAWVQSTNRLLIIDLIDCLIGPVAACGKAVVAHPDLARFSFSVKRALDILLTNDSTVVVVVTPHRRELMDALFPFTSTSTDENKRLILAAENGCVFKSFESGNGGFWTDISSPEASCNCFRSDEWRQKIRKLLEFLMERTPGSFIEESEFSFKWFTRATTSEPSSTSTLRELLLQRWAGPLAEEEIEIVLADRYVEIRPKLVSFSNNFAKIIPHPELISLFREPAGICITAGAFPYRDDAVYASIEETLSTYWAHNCAMSLAASRRAPTTFVSITVSHAKKSKANYSLPSKYQVGLLLSHLAETLTVQGRTHGA